ncbi:MAG: family 10 glycosylhydrolase [Planctomycetota bacterium]
MIRTNAPSGSIIERFFLALLAFLAISAASCHAADPEVRGTWLTTTANNHIATPQDTAETMHRLSEIGLNTVYVEAWKNGYTQFPSEALERVIGVDRRPALMKQDPSQPDGVLEARDLMQETVIEAHRNGLLCIAWFEYGFMAAHKDTQNHLREMYPHWLSRDIEGNEVAPNGFVWMNPLHPEPRRLLMDIVLEAVDKYDLDGVQLDDRIVWPYVTMGYDDYTVAAYRNDHGGAEPPADHQDPEWRRWRVEKVNEFSRQFVAELRAARPGLIVSLSPAPYPWCYENYLLEWPKWAGWKPGNKDTAAKNERGQYGRSGPGVWWDEFIPQCYRYDWPAFKATWDQQVKNLQEEGGAAARRVDDLVAGVLTTGSRPDPVPWSDLEQMVSHIRETGGGGHVWWFSRGVLDEYPGEIAAFYDVAGTGKAPHPDRRTDWRPVSTALERSGATWKSSAMRAGDYRLIVQRDGVWSVERVFSHAGGRIEIEVEGEPDRVELLVDRRAEMERTMLGR